MRPGTLTVPNSYPAEKILMAALTSTGCAARRKRLADLLMRLQLDAALITDVRDVYYFTGVLFPDDLPLLLIADSGGDDHLVCPEGFELPECGTATTYEWNHRGTRHPDPSSRMLAALEGQRSRLAGKRVGVQRRALSAWLAQTLKDAGGQALFPIDDELAAMQRRKDTDEVELIRASIRANLAAYAAVAEAIAPGVNELDVLSAGRRGAILDAKEKVFHDGDYQCGSYNGPARDRPIERGELYIVDAWTCYRGYWSDMSRTFVVGAPPTEAQQALFDHIRWIQDKLPSLLRPGIDGQDVYRSIDEMIRQHPPLADEGLIHHGGHAIGLRAHELPDINLQRGGLLEPGNVICVEPGGYFAAARYGVRLENMYLITDNGCVDLCPGEVRLLQCE